MEAVLRALADESRCTVLEALGDGPTTAGELAALLPIARRPTMTRGRPWSIRTGSPGGTAGKGELRSGGTFNLRLDPAEMDAAGTVEACEPPHRVRVRTRETVESWQRGRGPAPFDQTVEATLTTEGDLTRPVIEVRRLPLDRVASYGAGWQIHMENLAAYLGGREPVDVGARWPALLAAYRQRAADLR